MKLLLKEKVFSFRETFHVLDENGMPVYDVTGKAFSWGHQLTVSDRSGAELARIGQKLFSLTPRYEIDTAGGIPSDLRGHLTFLRPRYTLQTEGGDWEIHGNFLEHEYQMIRGNETVASVRKQWFTWGDTYLLEVPRESDAMTALAVMIAIDCIDSDTAAAASSAST